MKITNKRNVPDTIYRFLTYDTYDYNADPNTYSATTFNKSIREIILTRRHDSEIEVEAMDSIWRVWGSAVHAVLEKVKGSGIEPIRRLYAEVQGAKVSGKFDLIQNNRVQDYKVTSAWTLVFDSRLKEWQFQLSIYRYLYYKETGKSLDGTGNIIAILRDWAEKNLERANYPRDPITLIEIPLMSFEEVERELGSKIQILKMCADMADSDLPYCTDEERWLNAKTGKYNKCERYCNAYKFCNQAQRV